MNQRITILCQTILVFLIFATYADAEPTARNSIKFDNQSGRNAVIRVMGPTKAVAKMQRNETRIVYVVAGEYYILVRYGDSSKEYTYTKSTPFSVTESEEQFSIITFTLHRRGGGTFNITPVSGKEFETGFQQTSKPVKP